MLLLFLPNSPTTFRGFTHDERLMMIARLRKNQTGIEQRRFKADQAMEWLTDYKTVRPGVLRQEGYADRSFLAAVAVLPPWVSV